MVFWDNPEGCVPQTGNKAENRIQPRIEENEHRSNRQRGNNFNVSYEKKKHMCVGGVEKQGLQFMAYV